MRILCLFFAFVSTFVLNAAVSADSLWIQANSNYLEGKYKESVELYEQILNESGESCELYFNLGNSYFKQNMLGAARLNYERALRLNPADSDIIYNLQFTSALQSDRIDAARESFLTTWLNDISSIFSENAWGTVFFALTVLALTLLYLFRFLRISGVKKLAFSGFCLLFLLSVCSFYFGYRQRSQILNRSEAIIYIPEVTVKSTPNSSGADLFIIHEGLKVKVIEKQENHYRIILSDGKSQGWIPRESAEII